MRHGGHVSAERVLSGRGIENLYTALAAVEGRGAPPPRDAPAITAAALAGECPLCIEVLSMFCAILGGVAGDLALLYGARGGVFVAGGIPPRFPEFLAASQFRARFEGEGAVPRVARARAGLADNAAKSGHAGPCGAGPMAALLIGQCLSSTSTLVPRKGQDPFQSASASI